MSKVTDASAASSTAAEDIDINAGFSEFQEAERASKSAVVEEPPEAAPASEPVKGAGDEPAKPKQEPLTDEQKSAMKRANNEKRWDKLTRDLSDAQAEIERLKAPKADHAASATATKIVVQAADDPDDPRPTQDLNPKTGKPYDDFDEYIDDRSTWNARQLLKAERANQTREAVETQVRSQAETFMGKIGEYAKANDGFMGTAEEPGAFETVRDELEDGLQEVSSAIVEHDKPAELIHYLGSHPEALDKIIAHRGNPAKALIELGRIIATEFETPPAPASVTTTHRTLPKPPAAVSGRGHSPSGEAALDAAADANDFTAFQRTLRNRERKR